MTEQILQLSLVDSCGGWSCNAPLVISNVKSKRENITNKDLNNS